MSRRNRVVVLLIVWAWVGWGCGGRSAIAAQNVPRLPVPAEAAGFSGTLEGKVDGAEWNGKWLNLTVTRAEPADPAGRAAAEALVGKAVSITVEWRQAAGKLIPDPDAAAFIKALKRGQSVGIEIQTDPRGNLRLARVPAGAPAPAPKRPAPPAAPAVTTTTPTAVQPQAGLAPPSAAAARAPGPQARTDTYEWGWVPVGGGGNLMMTAFHPKAPGVVGLRSDVGGCFVRDARSPEAWRSVLLSRTLGTADSSLRNPSGFAFDPRDPGVMYVSCEAGLYKTADGGTTWAKKLPLDMRMSDKKRGEPIAVDPLNPAVIYAGTYAGGLHRSTDGGETWAKVGGLPDNGDASYAYPCVLVDPSGGAIDGRAKVVYASCSGKGVFRSGDGGATFQQISDTLLQAHAMRVDTRGALYLSTGRGLFRFEGGAWTESLLAGAQGFDIDPANPERIVAVAKGVQRSTDRGATWSELTADLADAHGWWKTWGNPWGGPNSITLDPHHAGRALFVTCYMAYATDDVWGPQKIAWRTYHQGIEETVAYELMTPPGSPYFYTGFGDIKGLRHASLTEYPGTEDATPGHVTPGMDYFPGDPKQIWHVRVGGWKYQGIEVFRSTDAGDTWTRIGSPFGKGQPMAMAAIAVSAKSPDNVVVCSVLANDGNRYTTDGGRTWRLCEGLPGNLMGHSASEYWYQGNILCADKVDARFYAYEYRAGDGNQGMLYTSTDGATWAVVADNLPSSSARQKLVTIFAAPDKAGWLVLSAGWAGQSLVSRDGGKTWKPIPGFARVLSADFGKPRPGASNPTLFVSAEQPDGMHGIYRSDDYFEAASPTWVPVSAPDFPLLEPRELRGCKQEYGRVFVAEGGRGWVYGRLRR